jgi:hypothetical protein
LAVIVLPKKVFVIKFVDLADEYLNNGDGN